MCWLTWWLEACLREDSDDCSCGDDCDGLRVLLSTPSRCSCQSEDRARECTRAPFGSDCVAIVDILISSENVLQGNAFRFSPAVFSEWRSVSHCHSPPSHHLVLSFKLYTQGALHPSTRATLPIISLLPMPSLGFNGYPTHCGRPIAGSTWTFCECKQNVHPQWSFTIPTGLVIEAKEKPFSVDKVSSYLQYRRRSNP